MKHCVIEETYEQKRSFDLPIGLFWFGHLGICAELNRPLWAQSQEISARVAEVKEAAAKNKQALAQYIWVEQVTISLKGEQKKQEHFQVRLGPDGKPQNNLSTPLRHLQNTRAA